MNINSLAYFYIPLINCRFISVMQVVRLIKHNDNRAFAAVYVCVPVSHQVCVDGVQAADSPVHLRQR